MSEAAFVTVFTWKSLDYRETHLGMGKRLGTLSRCGECKLGESLLSLDILGAHYRRPPGECLEVGTVRAVGSGSHLDHLGDILGAFSTYIGPASGIFVLDPLCLSLCFPPCGLLNHLVGDFRKLDVVFIQFLSHGFPDIFLLLPLGILFLLGKFLFNFYLQRKILHLFSGSGWFDNKLLRPLKLFCLIVNLATVPAKSTPCCNDLYRCRFKVLFLTTPISAMTEREGFVIHPLLLLHLEPRLLVVDTLLTTTHTLCRKSVCKFLHIRACLGTGSFLVFAHSN